MRFEVAAAFFIGILLPVLETARRGIGHWAINFTTMFEDYVGGVLLLAGAWTAHRNLPGGRTLLLVAWAAFAGLMSSSFFSQLEETLRQVETEPNNPIVVGVKFLLWSTGIVSLVLSFRSARSQSKDS